MIIEAVYTLPPADVAAQLTRPSASYKNSARLAVAGLLLFVLLYCALAGWFLFTFYKVFFKGAGGGAGLVAWIFGLCALFLGVFMVKAIFSVKNAKPEGLLEVTREGQPRLFAFLDDLADTAGAPRAHKVFLSARVNAAVFYDISLFNLIFPSKKNLEIGLALVNTLSLGEMRAVLAHEFGHFAQRSMAVGRFAYMAQQIASHLVHRRDVLDSFLVQLGNVDLRVRAVVAVVQLVVWSIRSLVESLFSLVILMQRALSREMEMQADLVAVSLTGSDALVHALHRMQGADDAWDRAVHFVFGEKGSGRATRDIFAVQSHMLQRMANILNDDSYARVPPLPKDKPEAHRVFKAEMAQPPKMWLTHPLNHEREANAKQLYVPLAIDPASGWSLFDDAARLREEMTAQVLGESEAKAVELEESLKTLGKQFKREQYGRRYNGIYFGRSLARHVDRPSGLRATARVPALDELAAMYPVSLGDDMQLLRTLETERAQVEAIVDGRMTAPGNVVRLRGTDYSKKELPSALARIKDDIAAVEGRLRAHDFMCRSWHYAGAARLGAGWPDYLDGLLALIHYTEHTAADLNDLHGLLNNVTAVATALRRVSEEAVKRIIAQANELHAAMEQVYSQAGHVWLDDRLCERLGAAENYKGMMGELKLPQCSRESINDWLGAVGGWVGHADSCLSSVRSAALEELLVTETMIARLLRSETPAEPAPAPSCVPPAYRRLAQGAERPRQTRLGWWARFQRADGLLPGAARLLVAGAIVALVLGAGSFRENGAPAFVGGGPELTIYNGLNLPVQVSVDGKMVQVAPRAVQVTALPDYGQLHIQTRDALGAEIDNFVADAKMSTRAVYNVAAATPLVQWTAVYGNVHEVAPLMLGARRWIDSSADYVFETPPESIRTKGSGGSKSVLAGAANEGAEQQLAMLGDDKERLRVALVHARFDKPEAKGASTWMTYASNTPEGMAVIAKRLAAAPDNVILRRIEYERTPVADQPALCRSAAQRSAASPDSADLRYLALRCQREDTAHDAALREAVARWPDNAWLANALAYDLQHANRWTEALPLLEKARRGPPELSSAAALTIARIKRNEGEGNVAALAADSDALAELLKLEKGDGPADSPRRAYAALAQGSLGLALANASEKNWSEARLLRLVAASDGAGADTVKRALALPAALGIDDATCLTGLALAMREGAATADYESCTKSVYGPYGATLGAFLANLRKHGDPRAAATLLVKLPPEARAIAYGAAIVLVGQKAPPEWRTSARRLLFASERPYFGGA
jgi:Zn-dependent protease with chaperone function